MTDESGTTTFGYDVRGNVESESRLMDGETYVTGYTYDSVDHIETLTYPSGAVVTYNRDALGRVSSVDLDVGGNVTTLASNIDYEPFGPMRSLTFGNGLSMSRTFDLDYRLDTQTTGPLQDLDFDYDPNDNIETIGNGVDPTRDQSFTYDEVNRLKTASGLYGSRTYGYDLVGNRKSLDLDNVPPAFNPAIQRTSQSYTFSDRNRLETVTVEGTLAGTYTYDGLGQRRKKTTAAGTTLFHYDRSGNLIAETDAAGNTLREYVYLDGLRIVQRNVTAPTGVFYIHTDHLGTSQALTDSAQQIVWQADYAPFGTVDVTTETVIHNLRFPGQYFDQESGLHYNYFRDYDPSTGRYVESDPIGLRGGLNTYMYGGSNPVRYSDPSGLVVDKILYAALIGGAIVGTTIAVNNSRSPGLLDAVNAAIAKLRSLVQSGETSEANTGNGCDCDLDGIEINRFVVSGDPEGEELVFYGNWYFTCFYDCPSGKRQISRVVEGAANAAEVARLASFLCTDPKPEAAVIAGGLE